MARKSARRETFWEGGIVGLDLADSAIQGDEILSAVDLDDFAPATLVRIRGVITAQWQASPALSNTNNVSIIHVAIRKVVLDRTTAVYAVPAGNLDDEAYLSTEDILMFGAIQLGDAVVAVDQSGPPPAMFVTQRAAGFMDVDVKAMRRFQSSEERLVVEAQVQYGQTTIDVDVHAALRLLFKAG